MNWLAMALRLASHIPLGKILYKPKESGKALEHLTQALAPSTREPLPLTEKEPLGVIAQEPVVNEPPPVTHNRPKVSTEETIAYQRREIGKELLLLEKHFQQQCKIGGKACDCCKKHPMAIEALSQEALGLSGEEVFNEIANWAKEIAPITSEEASASGLYDDKYPEMAVAARGLRKRIMGTEKVEALLSPALKEKVDEKVKEIVSSIKANKEE